MFRGRLLAMEHLNVLHQITFSTHEWVKDLIRSAYMIHVLHKLICMQYQIIIFLLYYSFLQGGRR